MLTNLLLMTALTVSAEPRSMPAVTVLNLDGKPVMSSAWTKNTATVLVFLSLDCPVANRYAPELRRLSDAYAKQRVQFIGVQAELDITVEQAREHAKDFKLDFPIVLDPAGKLIAATGAEVMSEVVVIDAMGKIVYRGRIDDRYTLKGKSR